MDPRNFRLTDRFRSVLFVPALFVFAAAPAAALESDDFNRRNLDPSRWTFVNPQEDGAVALVGSGTDDAHLELSVPAGSSHQAWQVNQTVRVMKPTANTDFEIEVRFASEPAERYQMQGLIIEEDADNWIRIEVHHDGSNLRAYAATTVSGNSTGRFDVGLSPGGADYLRLDRAGDVWTMSVAGSDQVFSSIGSFVHVLNVTAYGPFAGNHGAGGGATIPAYTAIYDYVFDTTSPIVPEDGTEEADVWPPLNHNVSFEPSPTELVVRWNTDEASEGRVEYGLTTSYELGTVSESADVYAHAVTLPAPVPGTTYQLRVCSMDPDGRDACSDNIEFYFDPAGPDLSIWYGDTQPFGQNGRPQVWANILGHIADDSEIASLTYRLNGGPDVPLSIGPDGRRLENEGDINIDISMSDLVNGINTVIIEATDVFDNETTETVTIDFQSGGSIWPLPYTVDWATLNEIEEIQDVAQVVDGKWQLDGGELRTEEPGYDRLVAVGDSSWTDVEFLVPITLHDTPSGLGAGVLLRWNGHTDSPVMCGQPKCGYFPLGAILWFTGNRFEIYGNDGIIYDSTPFVAVAGVTYWLRGRVETEATGSRYQARFWEDGTPEPQEWAVEGMGDLDDPVRGSALLLAHRADVSFGKLTVTDSRPSNFPPTVVNDVAWVTPGGSVDIDVLENDADVDGTIDPTSVEIDLAPIHGSPFVNGTTGVITYVHDGSPTQEDSLTYTVADDDGDTSDPALVRILISEDPPAPLLSDDFNRCVLDPRWEFINPLGVGTFSLAGTGSGDAHLSLSLPAGTEHDAWGGGGINETVRILQPTLDLDLQVEVKWNSEPTEGRNDQGVIIEQGPDDWLRFDTFHDGTQLRLFVGKTIGGNRSTLLNAMVPEGDGTHLRVTRSGDDWTVALAPDGVAWTDYLNFNQVLQVTRAGVFAGNPVTASAFNSEIDYVSVSTDPLVAEDGEVNDIEITTVGGGTVVLDPDLAVYACDDIVELTAVPTDGEWTFVGWSGDLEGTENPAQLTVSGHMEVTATFDNVTGVEDPAGPGWPDGPVVDGGSGGDPLALNVVAIPSPFRESTVFEYALPVSGRCAIEVLDTTGRVVRSWDSVLQQAPGRHLLEWNGDGDSGAPLPNGLYFVRLRAGREMATTRILKLQ